MPSYGFCSNQPPDPLAITPDPDISGLGVLIGFLSTAYIILIIIVVYYIFGYDPALNPFGREERDTLIRTRPNPFDQLILKVARRILCINARQWQLSYKDGQLAAAFDKCAISMADIQIVNGLGILITGSVLLPQKLSALYWKMIVYLGWFSCITNLSALTFLRSYLIRNPFERAWRLGSTFVLLVGLIVALIPTGHFFWIPQDLGNIHDAAPSAYAICYFNTDFKRTSSYLGSYAGKDAMILSILLLIFSYMVKLFKVCRGFGHHDLRNLSVSAFTVEKCLKSAAVFQRLIGSTSLLERTASNMMVAAHFVVCIWVDIFSSMASDIFWLIVSLAWGTLRITELSRVLQEASATSLIPNDDSTWSFGQILPVLLIAGPVLILVRSGREAFVPDSHGDIQDDTPEPNNSSSSTIEVGVGLQHDGGSYTVELRLPTEADITRSDEKEDCWMLDPSLFTQYYEESQWMCWSPVICVAYTVYAAIFILTLKTDPLEAITNFIFWFTLLQGACLQYLILFCSAINTVWKHYTVHLVVWCYLAGAIYFSILATSNNFAVKGTNFSSRSFGILPLLTVAATFGLFVFALVGAWLSRVVRKATLSTPDP
ncbi:hypothetical protein F5Y13DRAFT_31127 [Hypoxylon sp. FL1857]|nr:hypothetical protein F5Y13DRAFT_31127 [Hypoxylon sp. FL1857]